MNDVTRRVGLAHHRSKTIWYAQHTLRGFALLFSIGGSTALLAADPANQLTLTDLADYQTALSGKATAPDARSSDPPVPATFRDLWNKPEALKGRRVEVHGKIERVFRQGAVGQFPALAQAWAFARNGDPFCLVYPDLENADELDKGRATGPALGHDVQFTGTFLKIVEYPAGDGSRLAPMIVGDRPPALVKPAPKESTESTSRTSRPAWYSIDLIVGLIAGLAVAAVLGLRHLRSGVRAKNLLRGEIDLPLEFIATDGDSQDPQEGHHAG